MPYIKKIETDKSELKRQNMIHFIKVTQKLMESDPSKIFPIREIAKKAGFHNSTIYIYFKDIDELIALATLKYFAEYSHELSLLSKKNLSPLENFFEIWSIFCKCSFEKPHNFSYFFFGKHSNNLTDIITKYYELFPDEAATYSSDIANMYYGNNIYERCMNILIPIIDSPNVKVTYDNVDLINQIIISCFKNILEDKCKNPKLSSKDLIDTFFSMLKFIIES